jgi:protein ImuB
VIVRTVAERQVIVAASDEAADLGIRGGMTLTQARALNAAIVHAEHDPERDQKALEALGRWMMRFSPVVSLCGTGSLPVSETVSTNDHGRAARATGLFLDVTGCERLFGGLGKIARHVRDAMARLGVAARVAVAPTPGGAWALTLAPAPKSGDVPVVSLDQLESSLAPLPPAALRISDKLDASLHHLGLSTVGQLAALPREVLPARFGPELLERLDQALGRAPEPLVPLDPDVRVEARADFDGAVSALEVIWAAFQQLVSRVIRQLARRGRGARTLEVEFLRDTPLPPIKRTILLSRPSRDPVNLFHLFRCATEDLGAPPAPRSRLRGRKPGQPRLSASATRVENFQSEGFTGLKLAVPLHEPLADEQIALLGREAYAGLRELDHLVERLRVRLGADAVVQPELVESHVPERGWGTGREGRETGGQGDKGTRGPKSRFWPLSACPPVPLPPCLSSLAARPLHLLPLPAEVRVMVSPSGDREGRPVMFVHEDGVHRLGHCVGPERIAGRWWDGHDKTRDYFDVQDEQGRRFWVFRVTQTAKWYLHGVFE